VGHFYPQVPYLFSHMRTHTGETPFSCHLCDYKTKQQADLTKHMIIHSGIKPYKCRECDYAASRPSHLKQHQRTHSPASCLRQELRRCKLPNVVSQQWNTTI